MLVHYRNFRAFADSGRIEIRPITILVGENSSGKTSFMAGLRYMIEMCRGSISASFNRDPYFLGGFEEIVHLCERTKSRSKNFEITLTLDGYSARGTPQLGLPGIRPGDPNDVYHQILFVAGSPQPSIGRYRFQVGRHAVIMELQGKTPRCALFDVTDNRLMFDFELPSNRGVASYKSGTIPVWYLIDSLLFQAREWAANVTDSASSPNASKEIRVIIRDIAQKFRISMQALKGNVFASAPVRTQPSRTYTPSEMSQSSEGAHVPLELAKAKRRSPESWRKIARRLNDFGQRSGLFSEIDVRRFGRKDIDPFQISVKSSGPLMNLVDVGYGVSQALPLVYALQNETTYSTYLIQQPEVHLHPRAQAEIGTLLVETANRRKMEFLGVVETHSDYLIDRIRIEIKEGNISSNEIALVYFMKTEDGARIQNVYLSEDGDFVDVPEGFREFFLREHGRLLGI
jgi:hypothetical protein